MGARSSKAKAKSPRPDKAASNRKPSDSRRVDSGEDGAFVSIKAKKVSYEEMKKATNKFNKGNCITGEVFKGTLFGRDVVVKKITSQSQTEEDFLEEVDMLKQFKNKHVVQLVAFCRDSNHKALAFEYAPLGSLFDLLHGEGSPSLSWGRRLSVILGAAQGLEYLHSLGGLVHKRVRDKNVLVFPDYVGKIADWKIISKQDESMLVDSLPLGNTAWDAPELFTGEVTQASDVYSFGIIVLEVLSGRKTMAGPAAARSQKSLKEWALGHMANNPKDLRPLVDPNIKPEELPEKSLQRVCKLACKCLEPDPGLRPDMSIVVKTLQALR